MSTEGFIRQADFDGSGATAEAGIAGKKAIDAKVRDLRRKTRVSNTGAASTGGLTGTSGTAGAKYRKCGNFDA